SPTDTPSRAQPRPGLLRHNKKSTSKKKMTDTHNRSGASPPTSQVIAPTYEGDFVLDADLPLECGHTLACPTLHYAVYGRLNAARDNAVLVCHALSGS